MKHISYFFILILLTGQVLFAQSDFAGVPIETSDVLKDFSYSENSLSDSFRNNFPVKVKMNLEQLRDRFFSSNEIINGECKPQFNLTFTPATFSATDEVERDFLDGLLLLETSRCFAVGTPEDAIQVFKDADFKKNAFSTLKKIQTNNNVDCEWTSVPYLGDSNYCYLNTDTFTGSISQSNLNDVISFQTNLVFNNTSPKFRAPIFVRQTIAGSKKVGDKTAFYFASFIRTSAIPGIFRRIARKAIQETQENVFAKMEQALAKKVGAK